MSNHEAGLGVYLSATQITRAFGICRSGIFALMKKGLFLADVGDGPSQKFRNGSNTKRKVNSFAGNRP